MIDQIKRKFPYCFLCIIFTIIITLYLVFIIVLVICFNPYSEVGRTIFLIVYHVLLMMLLWSIWVTFMQDAGRVPIQWGFSIEPRNRKYCLICHVFKPERTHHCSACNRCVLNMDHHCPWINRCIGFYNRKAFILMLIYTTIITLINIIALLSASVTIVNRLKQPSGLLVVGVILIGLAFIFNCIIFVTISLFLKFHLQLIFKNLTTLETLEFKRQNKDPYQCKSKYDIGNYYNWAQVFGTNWLTWAIPIFLEKEGPAGDGVIWPTNQEVII